ncbi:hypothetical protein ACIGFL_08830 [Pseudomonas sp. NPDC077649]|uniref:hypothetical protein n=1 Tax=Pseudomonas sp. NPDC077649 TaxID=3364423 RepID=UPI0037C7C7EA
MTAQSTMKHKFDQEALDKLIENHLSFYKNREHTHNQRGAVEYVSVDTPTQMLHAYAEKISAGYTLHESFPVNAHMMNGTGFYSFYVVKPEQLQREDIEFITAEVTAEYHAERKRLYQQHLDFIVQESMEREKREQERKAQLAAEKAKTKFEAEARETLGEFA